MFCSLCCDGKWGCFLNLSFRSSLSVYRHARHFCALVSHPAALPESSFSSSSFLVGSLGLSVCSVTPSVDSGSLGLSVCSVTPSVDSGSLASSSPICTLFVSFSSLVSVARTSNTMLSKSGESGESCLRGNAFCLSPLRRTVCCGFMVYGLNYVEVGSLYTHFLESFYRKSVFDFAKSFSCIY